MLVSVKIIHSFYCFLKTRELDVSGFSELTALEMEFVRDSSKWLKISEMEYLLKNIFQEYAQHFVDEDFIVCVGHACPELGSWGELDSVLRISSEPLFENLPVFFSYFLSSNFSIRDMRKKPGFVSFKSNLSSEQYPLVTEYLRSILEALPLYVAQQRAEVKWIRDYSQIQWNEDSYHQASLFASHSERNLNPKLLSDFKRFFKKAEKELYSQKELLKQKDKEIWKLKDQLLLHSNPLPDELQGTLSEMEQNLLQMKSSLLSDGGELDKEDAHQASFLSQLDVTLRALRKIKDQL